MSTSVKPDDVIADVLSVARLGATVLTRAELVAPWGLLIDPMAEVAIHLVQRGTCWLTTRETPQPIRMNAGDLVLIRSGVAHAISDDPATRSRPHRDVLAEMPSRLAALPASHRDETTRVMCAKYLFQEQTRHPLLDLLPPLVVVSAHEVQRHPQLQLTLQLLDHEAAGGGRGSALVVPRLVDSLLVFTLRAWLDTQPLGAAGWFQALNDPAIARALSLIHRHPDRPWSVEQLAREVGQSRATFARHFVELVGETPAAYLTRWRMCIAAKLLAESRVTLDEITMRIGYVTTAAFSKAFRRIHGTSPGRYREDRRGALAAAS